MATSFLFGLNQSSPTKLHALLEYKQYTEGLYIFKNGTQHFIDALLEIGKKNNVKYYLNHKIKKINHFNNKILNIKLTNEQEIKADSYIITKNSLNTVNTILNGNEYLENKKNELQKILYQNNPICFTWIINKTKLNKFSIFLSNFHTTKKKLFSNVPNIYIKKTKISDEREQLFIYLLNDNTLTIVNVEQYIIGILKQYGLEKIYQNNNNFLHTTKGTIFGPFINNIKNKNNNEIKDEHFNNLYFLNTFTQVNIG